jgi:DNA helicase II / ATP-dependent DNA helicase PcrA
VTYSIDSQISPLSLEALWDEAGFTPNPDQRSAIQHVDGPLYLTAGPGSGKTRVLLWRTLNLIVFHGASPDEIFLSTFTEKAAHQLKEGLQTLLSLVTNHTNQQFDLAQMYIGTVHSLCQRLIVDRRFSTDRHRRRAPALLDELDQYFHVARRRNWQTLIDGVADEPEEAHFQINGILGSSRTQYSRSKFYAAKHCIDFFNRLSEEAIDPEAAICQTDDEKLELLIDLYQRYLDTLRGNGRGSYTDFSLIQQHALAALMDSEESGQVFRHIIIDEYQDTNPIQERLFFQLAAEHQNICVVGDDDQALYRFRGATVENFVQFPYRCQNFLGRDAHRISLSTNYRSREEIVSFYTGFMEMCDWQKEDDPTQHYRVVDKDIRAHREDGHAAVLCTAPGPPEEVCAEVAAFVRRLLDEGKVENPNQIAFLFPSLKSTQAGRMRAALEAEGLRVYAPRAGRFLEVEESVAIFGLFATIFGRPTRGNLRGADFDAFHAWLDSAEARAETLVAQDPQLAVFVAERRAELAQSAEDYRRLLETVERNRWDLEGPYDLRSHKRTLVETLGISERARRTLASRYYDQVAERREREGNPAPLHHVINRAAALDWNVLDLFYQLCGFDYFKEMFDLAEDGTDEGPICNLSLISQYLARFMEKYAPLLRPNLILNDNELFKRVFFMSYLYTLFRFGEAEYEDADDPFPKGRIPFLTIHQSKGLEFPVVVLANARKADQGPRSIERLVQPLVERDDAEPLHRMNQFDIMRMFYVALSRAENLLIVPYYRSQGNFINREFKTLLEDVTQISGFDLSTMPAAILEEPDKSLNYSFTSDYMFYKRCPRQYMIFRKYDFSPSHTQLQFFGSLVHRTLEDLHQHLIARREQANA